MTILCKAQREHTIKRWNVVNGNQLVVRVKHTDVVTIVKLIPLKTFKYKWLNRVYRIWLTIRYI